MLDEKLIDTLRLGFSSSVQKIKIPSLGNQDFEFSFREPNVKEINTFSKIVLSNSDSQSTIYASTLALMKYICLDNSFDVSKINELDRLKILTYILSGVFFSKNLTIKCPRVGCNNSFPYSMKYGELLEKIDSVTNTSFTFENKTTAGNISITACFPSTSRYLEFLEFVDERKHKIVDYSKFNDTFVEIDNEKQNNQQNTTQSQSDLSFIEKIKKRREILKGNVNKSVSEGGSIIGNVDFKSKNKEKQRELDADISPLYLKNITITEIPGSDDDYDINFDGLTYEETSKILGVLPAKLFIKDDGTNILNSLSSKIRSKLNECTPEIKCSRCGHDIANGIGVFNFFIRG